MQKSRWSSDRTPVLQKQAHAQHTQRQVCRQCPVNTLPASGTNTAQQALGQHFNFKDTSPGVLVNVFAKVH